MKLGKALAGACALVAVTIAASGGSCDDNSLPGTVRLQYAIFLAGHEPTSGEAACNINQTCALVSQDARDVELSITVSSRSAQSSGEIVIKCLKVECGFFNGATIASFKSFESFFYPGIDVLRTDGPTPATIGRIFVNMEAQSGSE
jgi:hypothetical protein